MRGQFFDGVECCINWAVTGGCYFFVAAFNIQDHRGLLRAVCAANNLERDQFKRVISCGGAGLHQRNQVFVVDFFLAISERFEPYEYVFQFIIGQLKSQISKFGAQRSAARVFAHDDVCLGQTHICGAHDLKSLGVFQHAILVDARLMRKRVFANDCFVRLHHKARYRRNAARQVHNFSAVDPCGVGHDVVADFHGHHNFFEGRVARTFAQTVDCTFDLTRTAFNGC